ncbi:hypothetical protein HDU83_009972, partial [Entophlyctis luteolus]
IGFRGTVMTDLNNWANNLRGYPSDISQFMNNFPSYAHHGFLKAFTNFMLTPEMWNPLRDAMQKNAGLPVYIVGHSLGG